MLKIKKLFTAMLSGVVGFSVAVGLTACGDNQVSDIVDSEGWAAAMASSDIYNSTATVTQYSYSYDGEYRKAGTTIEATIYVDLEISNGVVTGCIFYDARQTTYEYSTEQTYGYYERQYYFFEQDKVYYCYNTADTVQQFEEDGRPWEVHSYSTAKYDYTEILSQYGYYQFYLTDEYGYEYFIYDESTKEYVYETTESAGFYGDYNHTYEVVLKEGNLTYFKHTSVLDSWIYESNLNFEVSFDYSTEVEVTIPDYIQSEINNIKAQS